MTDETMEHMVERWRAPSKSWLPDCGAYVECANDAEHLLARLRGRSLHWRVKAKFISIGNTVGAGCLMEAADELDAILGQPIERERP